MFTLSVDPKQLTKPVHWLAFGLGSGLIKPAPGTWGTLAGLIVFIGFGLLLGHWGLIGLTILSIVVGNYICGKTAQDLNIHDHPGIVWDEFAGIFLTLIWFPFHWHYWVVGFIFFRLFDILKPFPIGWLDRKVAGGFGIMVDDLVAGLWAAVCLFIAQIYLFPMM